jgi:hypothetical protein
MSSQRFAGIPRRPSAAALTLAFLLAAMSFSSLLGSAFGASRSAGAVLSSPLERVAAPFTGPLLVGTPPSVEFVEPATGSTAGGTKVVITGTGFTEGSKVKVGTAEATEVKVESETEITAKTAAHSAGTAEVVVITGGGTSTEGPEFTYIAPPKVSGITPAQGSTAGGTSIKIKGTGFREGSKVKIGAEAKSVAVVSETEITAKTAAHAAGKEEVVVTSTFGASTGGPGFTYVKPPTVTEVEPAEGTTAGGASVTIKGTGFVKGATVTIGAAATSVVVVSETEITAKTAAHAAGKAPVVVAESGLSSGSGVEYTFVAPPTVASVSPAEGSTAGGTTIKVIGTGFTEKAKVKVGSAEATEVVVVSATEITAKTPAGAAGKAEVVVVDSKGTSSGGGSFTYVKPPTVTSISPEEGTTLGGTAVKVKGTGFVKGATVTIGAAATSVVVVSETEITAKTAAHAAGKAPVEVTVSGVKQSATVEYTFVTPPSVTKVEPATGSTAGGTKVVITGTGFTEGAKVKVGTAEATEVEVESETEITAKTPAGSAGAAEVVVTDSKGVSSGGASFTYVGPPSVVSVTPAEGSTAGGTVVKVKGSGFKEGSKVKVGTAEATEVKIVSETEVTAKTPAGSAGKAEVIVTDSFGSSTGGPSFTYVKPPTVTEVEPAEGSTLGGASVTIKGTGFVKGATVTIGSAATSVVVVSETEITAKTAAHAAGKAPVEVTVSGVKQSATIEYTFVAPPTVTSVSPAEGSTAGGTAVKVKGAGFTEKAKVKVGSAEATEVVVVSETEITAKTPAGSAGKAEVVVVDSKGTSSAGAGFTYVKPPTVTSISPEEGSTLGGTAVKVKGTGFVKGATVTIGAAATSVVVVSETEITAKTAAHAAGKAPVEVTVSGVKQSATVEYTFVTPPSVTKVAPAEGPIAGGTEVVITGTGFTEGAKVKVGTVEATEVEVESETEITAKTPAGSAGKAEVIVTDSKGTSSGGSSFTYVAPPKVSSVTPAEGTTAGGTVVKVKGTGFLAGSKVKVGSTEATEVKIVSETEVTAKTPAGSAGKSEVIVTDSFGASTGGPSFTYIKPPTVTEITPASGTTVGGTAVTIKGTGFLKGSTVTIGSAATSVVIVSETEITAKTAAHAAGKVSVEVTESGVKQSATVEYTYVAPPTISKIEPASGPHTGGREIVLTGTGFTEGAKVKVGSSEATEVTVVSETEITAKTPAGTAGKAEVTVTDSKGTSNAVTYTYT